MASRPIIAITGSSGLIGSALVRRLVQKYHVIGFDREGPPHPPPEAECITLDLASADGVEESLNAVRKRHGSRLVSVIHLASYYSFSDPDPRPYEEITVRGTERLLHGLRDFQVEQFIFSSTMLVHAPSLRNERITENSPLKPKWAYPQSKVKTEELIHRLRGPMPVVMMRIAGVYRDECHSIPLAHQIQRIAERQFTSHFFPGDMDNGQSFIHLDDLVDMTALIIERRDMLPNTLTLLGGEEDTLSYRELQSQFGRLLHGKEWLTWRIPKFAAKAGAWLQLALGIGDGFIKPWMIDIADDPYALDMSRAKSYLGWQPARSLRQTLPKMIQALKADPRRWYKENKLTPPPHLPPSPDAASAPSRRTTADALRK